MTTGTSAQSRDDGIDETSERWVTAVHEAGHALVADHLGARVALCRIDPDGDTGRTRHDATGATWAVVAVAGERATRLTLGLGGGSATDYRHAAHALTDTGHDLDWAEDTADDLLTAARRDLLRTARQLYRTGSRR